MILRGVMNMFTKAKERAAEGVGSLSTLTSSSLGQLGNLRDSATASLGSAVGQLQVGSRAKQIVKDMVSTPKCTLITGSLPTALVVRSSWPS